MPIQASDDLCNWPLRRWRNQLFITQPDYQWNPIRAKIETQALRQTVAAQWQLDDCGRRFECQLLLARNFQQAEERKDCETRAHSVLQLAALDEQWEQRRVTHAASQAPARREGSAQRVQSVQVLLSVPLAGLQWPVLYVSWLLHALQQGKLDS